MSGHLAYPILAPLGAAVICLALQRQLRLQRWVTLVALASVVVYAVGWLWPALATGSVVTLRLGLWPAPYGIVLAADRFSGILLVLSSLVGLAAALYGAAWLAGAREEPLFHPLYLVLFMGIHGALLTGDIFNLYVCFEVLLVASFALVVLGNERRQIAGAIKYVAISQVSSALFLVGAGLLYGVAGTLNMADLALKLSGPQAAPYAAVAAPLFLVAFGIKAAVFPLFFWLPAAYPTAKAPIMAVFGGLLTKVGIYALYRVYTLLFPGPWAAQQQLILGAAVLTMLVGVVGALAQRDLRRLLAFEVISQVGYLLLGLGLATSAALAAGIYFFVHIVLAKTAAFLLAGVAGRAAGTSDLALMGGLLRRRPAMAGLFLVTALSLAGVPPSSGFVAKYALVVAGLESGQLAATAVALGTSILTLYVLMRAWHEAFLKAPAGQVHGEPAPGALSLASLGLVALVVGAAVFAGPLYQAAQLAAGQLLDPAPYLAAVLGS